MNQRLQLWKAWLKTLIDPELRAIRRIILSTWRERERERHSADERECDRIFVDRLKTHPRALKLCFWHNHFEWQALPSYAEISGRILDFGCGSGHSDIMLARQGYLMHGVDLSSVGIAIARYLRDREPPAVRERLSFQRVDVVHEVPSEAPFDAAWASHVFEHITDPAPVLSGLRKWVKPGGYLLVSVPLGRAYDDPGHVNHYYRPKDLKDALDRYVSVKRIDPNEEDQVLRALCQF